MSKNKSSRFNKITIGLASPEIILQESKEVLKPKRLTIELTNQKETVCSARKSSVL
jgi:hypothetical protein